MNYWEAALGGWPELPDNIKRLVADIEGYIKKVEAEGVVVLPEAKKRYAALNHTSLASTRVALLGQDPYHGFENGLAQAMGLSFSVPEGVKPPPSLKNIYKELQADLGKPIPNHGDLTRWARQGVLLLNASLSVIQGVPGSHAKIGWKRVTDSVISTINEHGKPTVFMLWGKHAHEKAELVDQSRHLVIKTSHPSPLGAHKSGADFKAFIGSTCFSRANTWLEEQGRGQIDW